MADPQLMEQALMNIFKNAIEAIEESGETGAIEVSMQRDGDAWRLQISDTADLLRALPPGQLFTPFFSTKRGGQGLGLVFVREVLQRHGLRHRLESTADGRTCFSVWFGAAGTTVATPAKVVERQG
jgi:signal transduction histidine kinase